MQITKKQRELIKELAKEIFGDIEGDGFIPFSEWLVERFGYFDLYSISKDDATKVIEALKSTKSSERKSDGFWASVVRVAAKIYLKGFYDGRSTTEPAPTLSELERTIAEELGRT